MTLHTDHGLAPTPLRRYDVLSKKIGINLWVKHDDLYLRYGGGNKARKLPYIIANARKNKADSIVTAGDSQSNHVRATAIMCAQLGWKLTVVIHSKRPSKPYKGNLKLIKLSGAKIIFVKKEDVSEIMDQEMEVLIKDGFNPYYIWGGGHCIEGTYAYYKAVEELYRQLAKKNIKKPDYIILASGTGTTQAGLILGCKEKLPRTKVVGISIARKKTRGTKIIKDSIEELAEHLNLNINNDIEISFDDSFVGGGYESTYEDLFKTIRFAAEAEGLILDPTYTGKAFYALQKYVEQGRIKPKSQVIFWHTGGLFNLLANDQII